MEKTGDAQEGNVPMNRENDFLAAHREAALALDRCLSDNVPQEVQAELLGVALGCCLLDQGREDLQLTLVGADQRTLVHVVVKVSATSKDAPQVEA